MTRCSLERRVFYWEEPYWDADDNGDGTPTLEVIEESTSLWILRPHLPREGDANAMLNTLLQQFITQQKIARYISWYYSPMALNYTGALTPECVVYDCMDELSAFVGAPPELLPLERELLAMADVVFTGGLSLYEARRSQHANIHPFPSSIDVAHFSQALQPQADPADQAGIPHPRAGFFGVLDERFDVELIGQLATLRPAMHFILIGPVVKIDPSSLPVAENIHYLGKKAYSELPSYLAAWDVAILPFARNESTRFISPTKTPEYLAAGKPVVSTPIHDVVREYGDAGLVSIAASSADFARCLDHALLPQPASWSRAVDAKLATNSWDRTWREMWAEILKVGKRSAALRVETPVSFRYETTVRKATSLRTERYDYVVAGAGLAGSVLAERLANGLGKRVLIVDKRDHIGGNTYDFYNSAGLLVHKYGPHIFHTNSTEVVDYLSAFTAWRPYQHRVLAQVDGKLLPIPINLDTINNLYGLDLDAAGMQRFLEERSITVPEIRTSEDICVSRIGRELYEKFFRNYTRKQWGLDPSQLDASVAGRIPVRYDRDDRYFTDRFQAMPLHGYTRMFEKILDSPNITVKLSTNFSEIAKSYPGAQVIFTGPVDEFFDFRFGPLPYRSLRFEHQTHDREWFQPQAVVNYPNDHAYTRVTEFKYLTGQVAPKTSVVFEYPEAEGDPYYPIPTPENTLLYQRYKDLAARQANVHFVGRLATYKYYNMDQVVAQALLAYRRIHDDLKLATGLNRHVGHDAVLESTAVQPGS